MVKERTIFLLSASADIGQALMERYLTRGDTVIATYRNPDSLDAFRGRPNVHFLPLDLSDEAQIPSVADYMKQHSLTWDVFVACNGTMEPIGNFFDLDMSEWSRSIGVNALRPAHVLQMLYPFRRAGGVSHVAFFAGGGTNNPFRNYSAYCLSKILLIKLCELLDDEAPDLNAFIVGPGYVRTKIHDETLRSKSAAGANYKKTLDFLEAAGSSMDDIFECIEWCIQQGRPVVGGRNISAVHDLWRNGGEQLAEYLRNDGNRYKLRRQGNA